MLNAFRRAAVFRPDPGCPGCTAVDADPSLVAFSRSWKVLLHPNQSLLGACIVSTIRHVPRLADLSNEESEDFHALVVLLEPALERAFGAALVNFMCLRNYAFREVNPEPPFKGGKPNPHVHWHCLPRYRQQVSFEGLMFDDPSFGDQANQPARTIPSSLREKVIARIREELPVNYA